MRRLTLLALVVILARGSAAAAQAAPPAPTFAATVAGLSEPGGFFFSDNLVSNETSYLHVVPKLERTATRGGAYIGVGPEQNFSYIARTRPSIAFIIDIRRDNLLLHLFFKAIFERAETRLEYLCLLYARRCPTDVDAWQTRSVEDLVRYLDGQKADTTLRDQTEDELFAAIATFGVPVSPAEFATIRRLREEFVAHGLDLQFSSYGRQAIAAFPTVRDLYLERDLSGRRQSFLADHAGFEVVRRLEVSDKVIPIIGDLGGDSALRAIGRWLAERNLRVSTLYLSNVEFYLLRQGTFEQFMANVRSLPIDERSAIVRSYFAVQTGMIHPDQQGTHLSVQLLQRIERFLAAAHGDALSYWRLVTEAHEPLGT